MAKKALCVGINDYPHDTQLHGCVNDADAWAALLTDHYDFASSDIKLCLDGKATKTGIIAGLKTLLAGAKSGDVLVFANSSHGTYRVDEDGDEDEFDQAICPYDVRENVLLDDTLREMFSAIPDGVRLTVIADSCYSGSVTRGSGPNRTPRFIDPFFLGGSRLRNPAKASPKSRHKYPESGMKEILLSGCTDRERSFDAEVEKGKYHGALTYYALAAIRNAEYKLTYEELHARVQPLLDAKKYEQHPQLEGRAENKQRQIFT
jgi:hypothetical protein